MRNRMGNWRTVALGSLILLLAGCSQTLPGPKEGKVASADGSVIHFLADGEGEPALVFIHGWCCDRTYWEEQRRHFAPSHLVVLIDLAGHGDSPTKRTDFTMHAFAQDVNAVVEGLNLDDVILVGHSMGGAVMVEAALAMPDRVRGLVGVDNLQSPALPFAEEQIAAFLTHFEDDFPTTTEAWVRSMFPPEADSALVTRIATDMASASPAMAISALDALLHWFVGETAVKLSQLEVPLHAINSDRVPTDAQALTKLVDGYVLKLMPGRGHFPHLEDPETFNRLLAQSIDTFRRRPAP